LALLGFTVFKEKILYGNKRQTIRKLRKTPIKKGERLHLYWHLRQRDCESLGSWTCMETFFVKLFFTPLVIQILNDAHGYGVRNMTDEEALDLAKRDGFTSVQELFTTLERMHGPQDGSQVFQVIRW